MGMAHFFLKKQVNGVFEEAQFDKCVIRLGRLLRFNDTFYLRPIIVFRSQ